MSRPPRRPARSAGLLAGPALWLAWGIAGTVTPGYRPATDTVSWLGSPGQPHPWVISVGLVVYGSLLAIGAGCVAVHAARRAGLVRLLIIGYGGSAVVAGLAPKDLPGPHHTLTSQVHVAATVVGGGLLLAALVTVASTSPIRSLSLASAWAAGGSAIGIVAFRLTWGTGQHGAVELLLLATATLWTAGVALVPAAAERAGLVPTCGPCTLPGGVGADRFDGTPNDATACWPSPCRRSTGSSGELGRERQAVVNDGAAK